MTLPSAVAPRARHICARCSRRARHALSPYHLSPLSARHLSSSRSSPPTEDPADTTSTGQDGSKNDNGIAAAETRPAEQRDRQEEDGPDLGAMSARLAQMSEESLEQGSRSARRAVGEAGFDQDLLRQLEDRIAGANFRNEHPQAFAQAGLRDGAGYGTRDMAGARPWTGDEAVEDTALRMLTDAHKPLRGGGGGGGGGGSGGSGSKVPSPRGVPRKVDTGRPSAKGGKGGSSGVRLANARDRSSLYSVLKDSSMSEQEKEQYRREMKERFQPGGRTTPATIQGLTALANQRIEDAIARGQFKNLPRGQKLERDYNASSPFLDTTEYFMNKIIQKQEIVPPWIEKQQELVATASRFRARLRSDWKRHAARVIASRGGSLSVQLVRAEAYAAAEAIDNPPRTKVAETVNSITPEGHLSQITLAGELKTIGGDGATPATAGESAAMSPTAAASAPHPSFPDPITATGPTSTAAPPPTPTTATSSSTTSPSPTGPVRPRALPPPFRDPDWLRTEQSYLSLAIDNLNALTRSYNLMAPDLAKKPYFSLDRELRACYADVAPQLPAAIRERALAPPPRRPDAVGHRPGGVMQRFGTGEGVRVADERSERRYGFREFWRDLFAGGGAS
ncbi:hypothetical protein BDY21DRAFT_413406 [Lineolata rhizophorae]|uniref:DnaJ homologue subfamily C member 28 conserved domain-containing protein n=1 Tax=Lineolata rhizophorae TaxID=578093 RepID=A0A6A6P948_9PEZI|nr:hypothetical protein BDY21DRAFT_413406 [Lineolata rhizophorae]